MINVISKPVFFFFIICICNLLDFVLLQNPPSPTPWAAYYKETSNADFGIRMKYNSAEDKAMNVIISYDTETTSAANFFKNQITPELIDGFSECGVINWNFNPCTTSKFDQGALVCASDTQCNYDKFHSCIATAFNWHQAKMGKFLICFYTSGKTTLQCAADGGLIEDDVKRCVHEGRGAASCDNFHTIFQDARTKRTASEAEATGMYPDAINHFKSVTCQVLAQGSLRCDKVCST